MKLSPPVQLQSSKTSSAALSDPSLGALMLKRVEVTTVVLKHLKEKLKSMEGKRNNVKEVIERSTELAKSHGGNANFLETAAQELLENSNKNASTALKQIESQRESTMKAWEETESTVRDLLNAADSKSTTSGRGRRSRHSAAVPSNKKVPIPAKKVLNRTSKCDLQDLCCQHSVKFVEGDHRNVLIRTLLIAKHQAARK